MYLDNAATIQKPQSVINKLYRIYYRENANVHRSIHSIGRNLTKEFEAARECVRSFINAKKCEEIIFTKGDFELAHQPDEYVEIKKLIEAVKFFTTLPKFYYEN